MNYYNEIELSARRWLRELINDGLIPDGFIDNRPIQEVRADELTRAGFIQCHFFAGIGGWPYALRLAGWPDDEPVWTGSCPCQPFSASGKQMGNADSRHLFPTWRRLIARCRPTVVFGEQVASNLGREWLARVRLEMATLGYATRAEDLCSAGVAAPNLRQRLYWLADTDSARREGQGGSAEQGIEQWPAERVGGGRLPGTVANSESTGRQRANAGEEQARGRVAESSRTACAVGHADHTGRQGRRLRLGGQSGQQPPWSAGAVGIRCTDGKTRRIKPEIFPLAARLPGDLGLIRGAGNAINPWVAAKFIRDSAPDVCCG